MTSRYFACFCVRAVGNEAPPRFGFTVPRALGNAVQRNRIKRRMREAVRQHLKDVPDGTSVIFNPRRTVLDSSFEDLCREIGRVLARCGQS